MWKTFILVYGKFAQHNTHQILSESAKFCGTYDKKHFGMFFSVHSVIYISSRVPFRPSQVPSCRHVTSLQVFVPVLSNNDNGIIRQHYYTNPRYLKQNQTEIHRSI